jgi:type III pantothenate kinase
MSEQLLFAVDVGNTETKFGLFSGRTLLHTWRLRTSRHRTADEYAVSITQLFALGGVDVRAVADVVVASVVPSVNHFFSEACVTLFRREPRFFRPTQQRIMEILTDRPGEVGADLVAAAIAARERRGAPVIVITFGTATAYAAVGARGGYEGVAIAPGIQISVDALIRGTAKLPQVSLEPPPKAIGRTTVDALQSGILFGVVGQTEGIVARFRAELGVEAPVLASGGFARAVAKHTSVIDEALPYLVLEGLAIYATSSSIN